MVAAAAGGLIGGLAGGLGITLGETLVALLPEIGLSLLFGKRDAPDDRQILDLLIVKLQEKRATMS